MKIKLVDDLKRIFGQDRIVDMPEPYFEGHPDEDAQVNWDLIRDKVDSQESEEPKGSSKKGYLQELKDTRRDEDERILEKLIELTMEMRGGLWDIEPDKFTDADVQIQYALGDVLSAIVHFKKSVMLIKGIN